MHRSSRFAGFILALMGTMLLLWFLSTRRIAALHGADIVGLIGCGMCFGSALEGCWVGLRFGTSDLLKSARGA